MKNNTKGFTLIELLVVIAIVGLLSTMATVAARYAIDKAKVAKAQHAVDTIYNAITMLGNDTNEWPHHQTVSTVAAAMDHYEICGADADLPSQSCGTDTIDSGLAGITQNDSATPFHSWAGPYMANIALDPWGHQYFFDTNYYVNTDNEPCGKDGDAVCHPIVAVGSYGPDGLGSVKLLSSGDNAGGYDDVIKIISFN